MAMGSRQLSSLGSLLSWEADDPGDNEILSRLTRLVSAHLPDGWQNWKVHTYSREELLGSEMDPQILNKIRYAIPTVGLARALSPNCTSLPEKTYRDIKLKLLDWPLCVGLIIGPSSLAARIRGSAVQNELVSAALADMKPLLICREEANRELSNDCSDVEDNSGHRSINTASSSKSKKRTDRLSRLEESQTTLKEMLEAFMSRFDTQYDSQESLSESSDDDCPSTHSSEKECPQAAENHSAIANPPENDFDWLPSTKPQEPLIPTPKPHIAEQGVKVLRLGDITFNQIRYLEAQKKLHAAPVFGSLKANPILIKHTAPNTMQEQLGKTDYVLGTMVHGLLLQRDALHDALKELSNKHPALKDDLKSHLSTGSTVKIGSDDLLQFACGRKNEIIEQRRNFLIPKDEYQASLLNTIPPSITHLFCEEKLAEVLKQPSQQTFFRANYKKTLQAKRHNSSTSFAQGNSYSGRVTKQRTQFNKPRKQLSEKTSKDFRRSAGDRQNHTRTSSSRARPSKG